MLRTIGDGPYAYRVGRAVLRFPSLTKAVRHLTRGQRAWARATGNRPLTPREARLAVRERY